MISEDLQSLQSDPTAGQLLASLDETTRDALYRLLASLNHSVMEAVQEACEAIEAQGGDVDAIVAAMKGKPMGPTLDEQSIEALQDLLAAARSVQRDIFAEG
jgi:hypothetical protein